MNTPLKNSDSIAEWVIVALVVIVLGVAASSAKLDPAPEQFTQVDQIAAKVRMQMPIARSCANGENPRAGCVSHVASGGQP